MRRRKPFLLFACDIQMGFCGTVQSQVSEVEPGCGEGHFLINNENIISALVDTKHERTTTLCQLVVEARTGYRVRAIINYSPVVPHDCQRHFVHIGNDRHRLNKQSLTSYKYCNKTISEEIVSRKNFLWIVYSKRENEADLRIEISALKEVTCLVGELQCSPVQCVKSTSVCNGVRDCENGRDEYCDSGADISGVNEPCFHCTDGTCIRPTLPRYHDNWGQPLWYLCDGHKHCKDATDERMDICNNTKGRRDKVIVCRTAKQQGHTKLVWKADVECGGKDGCEWQRGEQMCSDKDEESNGNGLFIPILIVAIAVIAITTGFCVVHKVILLREKNPSPSNIGTRLDRNYTAPDLHDETPAEKTSLNTSQEGTPIRHSRHKFGLCHGGRSSLDTKLEEKRCFISTV